MGGAVASSNQHLTKCGTKVSSGLTGTTGLPRIGAMCGVMSARPCTRVFVCLCVYSKTLRCRGQRGSECSLCATRRVVCAPCMYAPAWRFGFNHVAAFVSSKKNLCCSQPPTPQFLLKNSLPGSARVSIHITCDAQGGMCTVYVGSLYAASGLNVIAAIVSRSS